MISDTELAALFAEAGEAIPTPAGIDAILEASRANEPVQAARTVTSPNRFASRGFLLSALGAAAVIALVVSVVAVSSPPVPAPTAFHAASSPALGLNATPSTPAKSLPAAAPRTASGASNPSSAATSTEKIITTGTLSLTVPTARLARTVQQINAIARTLDGYVSRSSVALAGNGRGGTIVLGVPATAFDTAVRDAEALGTVKHLGTTAENVTGQVADLGAQLSALEAARTQLEALLARAGTVAALLSVENEITQTQSQIQRLQAEQRVLSNEIAYSSLSVTIAPPAKQHIAPRSGFSKAWHDAITHFVNGLSSFVADSGVVLFALVLIAVIAVLVFLLGRMGWSIIRRRLL